LLSCPCFLDSCKLNKLRLYPSLYNSLSQLKIYEIKIWFQWWIVFKWEFILNNNCERIQNKWILFSFIHMHWMYHRCESTTTRCMTAIVVIIFIVEREYQSSELSY
jgi:hypothetical protein